MTTKNSIDHKDKKMFQKIQMGPDFDF